MFLLPWVTLAAALSSGATSAPPARPDAATAIVGPGIYRPLYAAGPDAREVAVRAFRMDRVPVTNGAFLAFVREHPEWLRGRVARTLADGAYLTRWATPDSLGPEVDGQQPVVQVSWFAARAFCRARGMRLPTRAEWEVAAAASETATDASGDVAWKARLLELYTRPAPHRLPPVGKTAPNKWGVRDLHGVVWEWVQDFGASGDPALDPLRSCAGGASPDGDKTDFAAFEREAMRSALRAPYTTANLGFRCAADVEPSAAQDPDLYDLGLTLRDQNGAEVPLDLYRGHPLLVSMFYASCPSACPLLLSNVARLAARLPPEVRSETRVLLVSFDPEHDTPEALRGIAAAHHLDLSRWTLATARGGDVARVASALGITYRKLAGGGFAHDSVIVAMDGQGRTLARADGPDPDLDPMVTALSRGASASPR